MSQAAASDGALELRAHHLLCALSYRGRGYGPDFARRFEASIDALSRGAPLRLGARADTLCRSGQNCGQCEDPRSGDRDRLAAQDIAHCLAIDTDGPLRLDNGALQQLRAAFAAGELRRACAGCDWFELCSAEARRGFRRARWRQVAARP